MTDLIFILAFLAVYAAFWFAVGYGTGVGVIPWLVDSARGIRGR